MEYISETFLGPSSNGRRPLWGPVKELGGRDSFILSLVLMAEVEEFFPLILSCLQLPLFVFTLVFVNQSRFPFRSKSSFVI